MLELSPPEDDHAVAEESDHTKDPDADPEDEVGHEVLAWGELIPLGPAVGNLLREATESKLVRQPGGNKKKLKKFNSDLNCFYYNKEKKKYICIEGLQSFKEYSSSENIPIDFPNLVVANISETKQGQ